ncbi:MAG: PAS domain-containing protein [Bacteroidetes bacterium]|nr:PAS domain-containing protein [Bacteroidota bacterium]
MIKMDVPILKYYDLRGTEEQLVEQFLSSYTTFLTSVINNTLNITLNETLKKWVNNQLPNISKDQLVIEDITFVTYIRKQAFFNFLPSYTSDVKLALDLVKEIEDYSLELVARSLKTLMEIQQEKFNEVNETLKKHEKGLLEAQEIASFGSFEWDLTGNEKSTYTPQVFKIFEMESTNGLEDFLNYVHPGDREKLQASIDKALKGGDDYECEYRFRRNGKEKILWTKGVVNFIEKKPASMVGTIMDITDRHYILQRLERNEELYKQAQKLTHIGNWIWDIETGIIKYSDELLRIYGLKPNEEMTFDKAIKLVHPNDLEKMHEALNYSLTTHKPHEIEFRVIRPDGDERIIRRHAEVLLDEKGKPYKLAGTGQDITKEVLLNNEIKEREKQLAELNLSLEQKNIALERSNKELTSFSYVASHDLQEPLRKIKTFSNLILEKEKNLSEEGKDCFGRIIISAGRMQTLIEDLLSFSRTQLFENTLKPVDLNNVLNEIRILHSETIKEGRLVFNISNLPVINAIAFQIQQLFENIISNSIKYSKPGQNTEIIITCQLVNGEQLSFSNDKIKKYYKISISDNGIGFDQKYADKIFEIFQRLHGKNEYSGTGIGLSICKKIVENHKGFIIAQSKLNIGSTFDIFLPQEN